MEIQHSVMKHLLYAYVTKGVILPRPYQHNSLLFNNFVYRQFSTCTRYSDAIHIKMSLGAHFTKKKKYEGIGHRIIAETQHISANACINRHSRGDNLNEKQKIKKEQGQGDNL